MLTSMNVTFNNTSDANACPSCFCKLLPKHTHPPTPIYGYLFDNLERPFIENIDMNYR